MQATIASGSRAKAPHELAINRAVTNGARTTPGVGFTNGESSFSVRRVRSRDNQTPLSNHHSAYGPMESGASHMLTRDANQQVYADLNYAAYTYGQSAPCGGINWPVNQTAYSDCVNGAGYGYDRDPPRSVNWSRNQPSSYADYVNSTYGYDQAAARNYMYADEPSYSKYNLAGQDTTLQLRNGSVSNCVGHHPTLPSGDTSVYSYGGTSGYQYRSWPSAGNVFTSRESSLARPMLYQSQDSAYYDGMDSKIGKSLSPPSSQLFLPDSSDFFLDYTDVGTASDVSSIHGSQRTDEAVHRVDGGVGVPEVVASGSNFFTKEVSSTGGPVALVPSPQDPKPARECKRLKIDTDLFRYPEPTIITTTATTTATTSPTTASSTEPTSATSSTNSSANRNGKRFPCAYCTKMFNRPSSRNTHELVHTGEKPHMCTFPTCGKRFSVLSNLRRHLKIHRAPPKGRGRHANTNHNSSISNNNNHNITNCNIINSNSMNNNTGNFIQGPRTADPHPYGGGVRDYYL